MTLLRFFKKVTCEKVLFCAAAAILLFAMYKYGAQKNLFFEGVTGTASDVATPKNRASNKNRKNGGGSGTFIASEPLGQNTEPSSTSASTTLHGLPPSCVKKEVVDPKDLLPSDKNSEWAKLNPMGGGDLTGMSLLQAGHHQGIDTVGQSLRNANLQLRSEPANPQMKVGPWNNSTIEPDTARRPLEIGGSLSAN